MGCWWKCKALTGFSQQVKNNIYCISLQGHTYPEGVGLPIGGEDKIHTHVLLEMHYDNPEERSG